MPKYNQFTNEVSGLEQFGTKYRGKVTDVWKIEDPIFQR